MGSDGPVLPPEIPTRYSTEQAQPEYLDRCASCAAPVAADTALIYHGVLYHPLCVFPDGYSAADRVGRAGKRRDERHLDAESAGR